MTFSILSGVPRMARSPIVLPESEQVIVAAERDSHPDPVVRRKMLVLWSTHCGVPRAKTAAVAGVGRATAQRYLAAYRAGGLDELRRWAVTGPVSDLATFAEKIKNDLTATPVRTTAEARDRIEALTGIRRGLTQTRTFLAGLGFTWQRTRAVPVPPKSL
jgi:transposase